MSLWVLDTDILTLLQWGHPAVSQNCAKHPAGDLAVAVISVEEQFLGWLTRVRRAKARDELARGYQGLTHFASLISRVAILSFTEPAILRFEQLLALRLNIAKNDLRIAAVALEHDATLVTRNLQDFQRIPGLKVEDWAT